jgi:MFS transporter, DHA1 family, multidrug resistance protein
LAIHIFVPALPQAANDLRASARTMQMTVSLYILGLAIGQLVYGPLSDRFGRKPVLIVGIAVYTAAGLVATLASKVEVLIAARLFQALGGCAGLALARAIVRDTAEKETAARQIAILNLMITLGPALAPIIGALLASTFGWRSILAVLCCVGFACICLTWQLLPETADLTENIDFLKFAHNYRKLLVSPSFLGYALGGACATTSIYAFISAAPFIFIQHLHRPEGEIGIYLAIIIGGVSLGNVLSLRLTAVVSLSGLLIPANLVSVLSAFVLFCGVLWGQMSFAVIMSLMFIFSLGVGMTSPLALIEAVSINPLIIGSASGLYGFTQMTVGAICSSLVSVGSNQLLCAAGVLAGSGIIAQVSFHIAKRSCRP